MSASAQRKDTDGMLKEIFMTPCLIYILDLLNEHQECTVERIRIDACNGKSPEKALDSLLKMDLAETDGEIYRITPAGRKVAGMIAEIDACISQVKS